MELKSCSLLTYMVLLIPVSSFHYQLVSAIVVGGWQPITDPNTPFVLEISRFAVDEHNNKDGAKLQFVKVVKGETQFMFGKNYKLVIAAVDRSAGNVPGNYEVVVWDEPQVHFRRLTSFTKLIPSSFP